MDIMGTSRYWYSLCPVEVNAVFCSIVIVSHTVSCHRFTRILITFVFHCCRIDCFGETCAVCMRARFLRMFCSSVGHSGECEGIAVRSQMLQAAATPVTGRENPLGQEKTVCIPVAKFHRAFIHLLVSILAPFLLLSLSSVLVLPDRRGKLCRQCGPAHPGDEQKRWRQGPCFVIPPGCRISRLSGMASYGHIIVYYPYISIQYLITFLFF